MLGMREAEAMRPELATGSDYDPLHFHGDLDHHELIGLARHEL